jgi:hypothetical protein
MTCRLRLPGTVCVRSFVRCRRPPPIRKGRPARSVNSWTLSRAPYQSQNDQENHRADEGVDDRGNNASANYDADLRQQPKAGTVLTKFSTWVFITEQIRLAEYCSIDMWFGF